MRILLAIVIALAAAWAGYWFIGSSALQSGIAAWFEARRAEGWVARYDDLSINGFPNRFDVTLTSPALSDPASELGWQAPFFQLMTLSYKPHHVIAIWPHEQRIETPAQAYKLTSGDMRASLIVAPSTALALRRSTLTAEAVALAPEGGEGALSARALRLAGERMGDDVETGRPRYHLGLAAEDVAPPARLIRQIDPDGALPRVIESVIADLTVGFDAPWDRRALEDARPQPTQIAIKTAGIDWGNMSLAVSGLLKVDIGGRPTGLLTLSARNWRRMLEVAADAGIVSNETAETAGRTLSMLAGPGDEAKPLEVPLRFEGGRIWIGPLPIARAPILRLR